MGRRRRALPSMLCGASNICFRLPHLLRLQARCHIACQELMPSKGCTDERPWGRGQHRSIRCTHCRHRPAWGVDARPHFTRVEVDCKEQHCTPQAQLYLLLHQVAGVGQLPGNVGQHLVTLAPARAPCDGYASLNGLAHRAGTTCWVPMQQRQARNMAAAVHKTCHAWQPTLPPQAHRSMSKRRSTAPRRFFFSADCSSRPLPVRCSPTPPLGVGTQPPACRGWVIRAAGHLRTDE